MRRYIIWGIVIFILIFCTSVILRGSKMFGYEILSYSEIGKKDKNLDAKIEELRQKSTTKYNGAKQELSTEISEYEKVKEEYLNKIEAAKTAGAEGGVEIESYDIEFLWTVLRKLCNR